MCAMEAAKRGRSVTVIEHNAQIGRKILISGGGRCNFTNLDTRPENFLSRNPHFAKSALARYGPHDFVRMVERHAIRYHEKKLGQLFCDGSAAQIVDMLERECLSLGARIVPSCTVTRVAKREAHEGAESLFQVETNWGIYTAASVVIATGGLSIPKIGATPFGYAVAGQFGLEIAEPRPALVPLLFGRTDLARFAGLAGVSTEIVATAGGCAFREKMLFTHRLERARHPASVILLEAGRLCGNRFVARRRRYRMVVRKPRARRASRDPERADALSSQTPRRSLV